MNKKITISSNLNNIRTAVAEVLDMLKAAEADESDIFDIRLCIEEALINAIKYGNRLDEKLKVVIDVAHNGNKVAISIEDQGKGFDYRDIPDPTEESNLLKAKGRGVFLIKHLMDELEFNKKGNRISMIKHLRRKPTP